MAMTFIDQPPAKRFAVLRHTISGASHFDFLVEAGPTSDLATWRLVIWPVVERVEARRLKDHRRLFLDYEGELTAHRGWVERVDGGMCRLDIGEGAVWQIVADNGSWSIEFRQQTGDQWIVEPITPYRSSAG